MAAVHVRCLACGSPGCETFLELGAVPVVANELHDDREAAENVTRGDMALAVCSECSHVFNARFDPERIAYTQAYENALDHSPRFREYQRSLVEELVRDYPLGGSHVVEIASGQGQFLRQLCREGGCRGIGYDPSYRHEADPLAAGIDDGTVRIESERFDAEQVGRLVKHGALPELILCRQALEHFERPREFLSELGDALAADRESQLVFEVPNSLYSLFEGGIWDFIYEHVSYFSPSSLAVCFEAAGFAVGEVKERFGGQFLTVRAAWPANATPVGGRRDDVSRLDVAAAVRAARRLGDEVRDRRRSWRSELEVRLAGGEDVVVWGAGSKGITFLNLVGETGRRLRAVDLNPKKHGKYVSGAGVRIEDPDTLAEAPPAMVVVMNPLYLEEVREHLERLRLSPRLEVV